MAEKDMEKMFRNSKFGGRNDENILEKFYENLSTFAVVEVVFVFCYLRQVLCKFIIICCSFLCPNNKAKGSKSFSVVRYLVSTKVDMSVPTSHTLIAANCKIYLIRFSRALHYILIYISQQKPFVVGYY